MPPTAHDPRPRVLVLRGSPDRDVADVTDLVATELRAHGVHADVRTPDQVDGLAGYDGVVVGSRLTWRRWHPAAVRFLRRHAAVLRVRPSWLFQIDRHAHLAAAGAVTGLAPDRVPQVLATLLDSPVPVTLQRPDADRDGGRRLARSVLDVVCADRAAPVRDAS